MQKYGQGVYCEMQQGRSFTPRFQKRVKNIAALQLAQYSIRTGDATGSNPVSYTIV